MENFRFIKIFKYFILGGALFALPLFSFAYNEKTTHPALTQEIVKFYNYSFPENKISGEERKIMMQGSTDEDRPESRTVYHFYDPVYKRGLTEFVLSLRSSKDWSQNIIAQAKYDLAYESQSLGGTFAPLFGASTDYTWERAIYEYVWGDKTRGLESLGHILHLIEDATVPEHTRNDMHDPYLGGGSPYESWAVRFNPENINVFDEVKNEKPILLASLNDYFDAVATYSNNNFFSQDTIFDRKYTKPTIKEYKGEFGFHTIDAQIEPVVRKINNYDGTTNYTLIDKNNYLLNSYWSLLSKQAVLNGAGVVKLFFDEAQKEKKTKLLYEENRSWLGKQMDKFKKDAFGVASALYGSSVKLSDLENDAPQPANPSPPKAETKSGNSAAQVKTQTSSTANQVSQLPKMPAETAPAAIKTPSAPNSPPAISPKQNPAPVSQNTSAILAFAGVAGPAAQDQTSSQNQQNQIQNSQNQTSSNQNQPAQNQEENQNQSSANNPASADTVPPDPPLILNPSQDGQVFNQTNITFSGRAEAGAILSNNFSSSTAAADASGNWALAINSLAQGATTLQFFAKDQAGNISQASERSVFVDSEAPDISLNIKECADSLANDGCLSINQTATLEWSSAANDLDHFAITCEINNSSCPDFNFSNTSATTIIYQLADNSIYKFAARAVDKSGNQSDETAKIMEVMTRPVVINEIMWSGTSAARAEDEWIELFNPSDKNINLGGWVLRSATDNTPYIKLAGEIPANGFFILERTDDHTISDIAASQVYTGSLANSGEVLELSRASTTIDKTPEIAACVGWCGGSFAPYYSMERYDFSSKGDDKENWGSWGGFLANGKNADNLAIYGTPGKRNSINYLISKNGSALTQDKILKKSDSPYLVTTAFNVPGGVALTIDPGVVIKFFNTAAGMTVNGKIIAEGETNDKIVFTSFKDDDYGGDTNQDATGTSPQAADWLGVKVAAEGSSFNNAIFRYGGINDAFGNYLANLRAENSSPAVKNSVFEKSGVYGIYLKNSASVVESNLIKENTVGGLLVSSAAPAVRANRFWQNNGPGIILDNTANAAVENNIFSQNAGFAVQSVGSYASFSGNSASGNNINGINVQGTIQQNYTLVPDLPYVIQNTTYTVPAGKILTVLPGTIFKLDGSGTILVNGKLNANGTDSSKIVFTSLKDDDCGISGGCGDTDNASSTPAASDWQNLKFISSPDVSTLNNVLIRYGGMKGYPYEYGALRVSDSNLNLQNSTLENNFKIGIWLNNSASTTIADSLIQNQQEPTAPPPGEPAYGLFLQNSSPTLQNIIFRNNKVGVQGYAPAYVINGGGIIFENNLTDTEPAGLIP